MTSETLIWTGSIIGGVAIGIILITIKIFKWIQEVVEKMTKIPVSNQLLSRQYYQINESLMKVFLYCSVILLLSGITSFIGVILVITGLLQKYLSSWW